MTDTYAQDGVDAKAGGDLSAYAGDLIKKTWGVLPDIADVVRPLRGTFRGPRGIRLVSDRFNSDTHMLSLSSDGIGTKVGLHSASHTFVLTASDLIAMLADDVTRYGGLPVAVSSVLDVGSTKDSQAIKQLFRGLVDVAFKQRIIVLNGELAEMGVYVGGEDPDALHFIWSGTMLGLFPLEPTITGEDVAPGDVVVALREHGFRSNGISSVREAFRRQYGDRWWSNPDAREDLEQAVSPSTCYSQLLSHLNGWFSDDGPVVRIKHAAHISGGGIIEKFGGDLLARQNLRATLPDLFEPPEIMQRCRKWRGFPDNEVYSAWNGGQGMLLTVASEDASAVIEASHAHGIEAKVAGNILGTGSPSLRLRSKFSGKTHEYPLD